MRDQSGKLTGFDFLRAIFSVVVIAVHVNLLVVLSGRLRLAFVADIFNQTIGYLAVPTFFQIALFLFFQKSREQPHYFVKKRLPRLVFLYLFWVITKLFVDAALTQDLRKIETGFSTIANLFGFVISGGYSAFYFFFSLLFLTAIAAGVNFIVRRTPDEAVRTKMRYCLLWTACGLILWFSITNQRTGEYGWFFNTENPLNFLPYILTAAIAAVEFDQGIPQHPTRLFRLKLWGLGGVFLLVTILEWLYFKTFLGYARLSLVAGSWLLLYLALRSTRPVPAIIKLLSAYSLGIYGFHVFFVDHTQALEGLSKMIPGLGSLIRFAIALFGSLALTFLFKKVRLLKSLV